ncbi:MAG: hypothetical protein HY216_15660 [Candidatus Rokubacteria bacterium]|nr:hypothetical protein [Candidatus Rokubacteria bacterium]
MTIVSNLHDDGAGSLGHPSGRFLLVRPETLVALQRACEAALGPEAAAECFAAAGRAGGGRAAVTLTGSREDRVRAISQMGTGFGWGEFRLERLTPDTLVMTVRHSPFAEAYGPSPRPVCHLTRGVLEALATVVLDRHRPIVETLCAASGADACRFESR